MTLRYRNRMGRVAQVPTVSATRAKNEFGRVVEEVERTGAVAIERYGKERVVILSIEEFEALTREREAPATLLEARLDELFARLAEPGSAAAMDRAFRAEGDELGRAAVHAARRAR